MRPRILIVVFLVMSLAGIHVQACAQAGNPLRHPSVSHAPPKQQADNSSRRDPFDDSHAIAIHHAPEHAAKLKNAPQTQKSENSFDNPDRTVNDPNVLQAMHKNPETAPSLTIDEILDSLPKRKSKSKPESNSEPSSEAGAPKTKQIQGKRLNDLIQSLALNTCLVMAIAVGFILVAKRWVKGGSISTKSLGPDIKVAAKLQISPKASLLLVEAGEQRLVVANDQNGIKSVVPLNESFADTLGQMSDSADGVSDDLETDSAMEDAAPEMPYSLASIGKKVAQRKETNESSEDQLRLQMESALQQFGLKELIMKSIHSKS